ncbi:MAG: Ku protein [Candidatus Melainabacteria bacterium]|nr:MAG: Ku protein [Candidatus Melainabacteria bacterium]
MPRAIWSGVISFGLVSIPVKLYTATESKSLSFHQLHEKCKTRIKEQRWCPHCDKQVDYDEIVKGFEYSKGDYVVVTRDDLEELPLPSKNIINISAFIKAEEIDPLYFNGSYYLEPEKLAQKPCALFMHAMEEKGMVAIGTLALRNKERLCSLRVLGGNLLVEMLLYPDEIRVDMDKKLPAAKLSKQELSMASSLIDMMTQDFQPDDYEDHYREALQALIKAKIDGDETIEQPEETKPTRVVDLMEALRASVENAKSSRSKKSPQAEEEKVLKSIKRQTASKKSADKQAPARKGRRSTGSKPSVKKKAPEKKRGAA